MWSEAAALGSVPGAGGVRPRVALPTGTEHQREDRAEAGALQPRAQDCPGPPGPGQARKDTLLGPGEEFSPVAPQFQTLASGICCLSPSLQACVAGLICGGRGCRWPHSCDLPCIAGSLHVSEPHPSPCGGKSPEDVTPAVSVGACSQGGEGSWGEGERHRVCPAGWGRGQDRGSVLTLSLHPPPASSLTLLPRRSDNQGPVLSAAHFPRWCMASGRCRRSVSPA